LRAIAVYRTAAILLGCFLSSGLLPQFIFGQDSTSVSATSRPNIVVFLVDDMGWMDCGVYGSKYYETPHIDRFAKRAMRFTDA
jgi:hypothetical protein